MISNQTIIYNGLLFKKFKQDFLTDGNNHIFYHCLASTYTHTYNLLRNSYIVYDITLSKNE